MSKKKTMQEHLDHISSHADPDVRICRRIEVGKVLHQGDVYIHRVEDDHPHGAPLGTRKVAVGEGIGSNHIAEGDGVEVYVGERIPVWVDFGADDLNAACRGPVVVALKAWTLTHPRHPHHVIPAGTYQVTYQIDLRTRERVME